MAAIIMVTVPMLAPQSSAPFMILDIFGLALVIFFPRLVLWLPSTMM